MSTQILEKVSRFIPKLTRAEGEDYHWGRMVGEAEKERIRAAHDVLSELAVFRIHQPWWLPYSLYLMAAERSARSALEGFVTENFPRLGQRLRGMADGSGVRLETLFLFHMLESACSQHGESQSVNAVPPGGCSAIGFGPGRVLESEPVLIHNLDQVSQASPFLTVRRSSAADDLEYISLTLSPLCGVVDGINEAGLCISYNYAATIDVAEHGTPASMAISDALSRCRTVPEALERIVSRKRSHGAMLMLADASGFVARLELAGHTHHVEVLNDPDGVLFHTNRYRSAAMQSRQVAPDAVYGQLCPESIRGVRILESSEVRDERLKLLISEAGMIGRDSACQLLTDHEQCEGSANTICMHGDYWSTIASVRMLPQSRVISVSYGPACEGQFHDFSF